MTDFSNELRTEIVGTVGSRGEWEGRVGLHRLRVERAPVGVRYQIQLNHSRGIHTTKISDTAPTVAHAVEACEILIEEARGVAV